MDRRFALSAIYGICFFYFFLPARLEAQNGSSIIQEYFKGVELIQVFQQLEEKYNLKIAFAHEAVKGIYVNRRIDAQNIEDAFRQLLNGAGLEFQMVGERRILIRPAPLPDEVEAFTVLTEPEKKTIKGQVKDAFNSNPLPYANIYCSTGQGATTDERGAFQLEVAAAEDQLNLQVSYVGYVSRQVKYLEGEPISIALVPEIQELESVTVFEQIPLIAQLKIIGATEISADKFYDLPSFAGGRDLFRDLQLLPGVGAHDDLSANFSVRGGNEEENLIIFDGMTLYNVDHFFGVFSAVNPSVVDKITIYKNAFPAEYGGRTSSVIDVRSNPLDLKKVNGQVELNLLTSNAYLEIPFSSKIGLSLGGRITNKNLANTGLFDALNQDSRVESPENNRLLQSARNQVTAIEPDFRFNDLNAKLFWQIDDRTSAAANFFSGYDDFNYSLSNEIKNRRGTILNAIKYEEAADWANRGFSLQFEREWTDRFSSRLNLAHSYYQTDDQLNYRVDYTAPQKTDSIRVQSATNNEIKGLDINLKNSWQINDKHQLHFGLQYIQNDVRFQFLLNEKKLLDGDQSARQNIVYAQHESQWLNDRLRLQLGLRQTFYDLNRKAYFSPRLTASFQLNDQWLIKGAWSKYHQLLREFTHETALGTTSNFWLLANENRFPVSSSVNRMLGLHYAHPSFELDIEFYDRNIDGVLEHAQVFTGLDANSGKPPRRNFLLFIGEGQTRGIDVLLKKSSGKHTGWLSYTLSKSTNSFPEIDRGNLFPAQNDRRHQLQLIQQYQLKNWSFALTYVFSSGRPYTDLSILGLSTQDRRQLSAADRISYLEDYHRVDIGVNYQFKLWKNQAELGFSIFNLLNRQNVKYRQFIFNSRDPNGLRSNNILGTELQMLSLTPNLRFSWQF